MAVTPKERKAALYLKDAAGAYVLTEPIDAALVAAASTGQAVTRAADGTLALTTVGGGGGGGGSTVLYDSGPLGSPANSIDTGAAGIAGGYDELEVIAILRTDEATVFSGATVRVNGSSSAIYDYQRVSGLFGSATANAVLAGTGWLMSCPGSSVAAGVFGFLTCRIPFYTETTAQKMVQLTIGQVGANTAHAALQMFVGNWRATTAISQFSITAPATKNFVAGSRLLIIGRGGAAERPPSADDVPGGPNTENDEFDGSTLDAKWTQTLTGSPTVDIDTTWPSHYMAQLQAGGSKREARLEQAYVPAGDFSLTVKAVGAFCEADQACVMWGLNSGATEGWLVQFRRGASNLEVLLWTIDAGAFTVRYTVAVGSAESTDTLYLHLQRVGTSLQAAYSHGGRSFRHIGTHTKSYTQEVIRLTATVESSNTVKVRAGFDWIRRDWLTLSF